MGYEQTILSQISQLRDVLQRYHGFAVIRELIQNADDARATRLDLGCIGPLADADHPLLNGGPALFVLNDGPFTPDNARSIKQLGLSNKAGDAATIGKFGLGLKSIHHLGEVYFYLSSADFGTEPTARYRSWGIQNPWHDPNDEDSLYPAWNEFTPDDRRRIADRLHPLLADDPWFCLVVPLRRRDHVGADSDAIAPTFPGDAAAPDSAIFAANFEAEVAQLLPLLRHLRSVRRWSDQADGILQEVSHVSLTPEAQRSRVGEPIYGLPLPLHGTIAIDRRESGGATRLTFAGQESYQNHAGFAQIAKREDWPRPLTMPRLGLARGRSISQPEPSMPHAAACFTRVPTPAAAGRFVMTWAIYLPVKLPPEPEIGLPSPDLVTLTLHGRFFTDPGRVGIDFSGPTTAADSRSVGQRWNDLLRDDGTLDLVIPALNEFAARLAPPESPGLIRSLTGALRRSSLFQVGRGAICQRHQWAYLVGRDGAAWTRLEGDGRLHAVPEPAATDPPLAEVFPQLPLLGRHDFHLTYRDWPSLRRSDELHPWPENALHRLLGTDQTASFTNPARMGLVVRTLRGALPTPPQPAIADRLVAIARAGLTKLGGREATRRQGMIEPFLDLIPPARKLALSLRDAPSEVAEQLLAALWGSGREPLVVPFGVGEARPRADERAALVECLLALDPPGTTDAFHDARAGLVCQIVAAAGGDRDAAWAGLDDRPIFPAIAGDGGAMLVGRRMLATALRGSRLFVDRLGLARALRAALGASNETGSIVTISRPLADAIFGGGVVPDADAWSCLVALATGPALRGAIECRAALVERLVPHLGLAEIAAHRMAFRYLLHADRARRDDEAPLLFEAGPTAATAWVDLARRALQQDDGGWRVVPRELAELFTTPQRAALGVAAFDRPGVVGMLRSHGPGRLDLTDLPADAARTLIDEAAPADFDVIRALPIHMSRAGHRISLDDRCRWRGDFDVEADLAEGVIILEPHSDPVVASKQRVIHPPTLDARGVIDLILRHPEPRRFGRTILAALAQIGSIPTNHSVALRSTRWVETTDGRAVMPAQVVRLSFGDETVAAALATVERDPNDAVSILELAEPFRRPGLMTRLFLDSSDALERLGRCLGRDPRYRIGNLQRDQVRLDAFRLLFDAAPADVMPCLPLFKDDPRRAATRENIDSNLGEKFLPQLIGEVPADRLATILQFLASRHRSAPAAEKGRYLDGYCRYLEAATRTDQVLEILAEIPLLNQAGGWTTASLLAMKATNIHAASLLDDRFAEILANHADRYDRATTQAATATNLDAGTPATLADEADHAVGPLRDFLEEWAAAPGVNRELIGGLLALLGDGPGLTVLAAQFLGNFDRAELRNQLNWRSDAAWTNKDGSLGGGAGRSLADLMRARRVIVELDDGDQITVTNLLGDPIGVPLNKEFADLLLPHVDLKLCEGHEYIRLRLRRVTPRRLPAPLDPAAVLRRTARRLLEVIDRQQVANFGQVWDRLARSEQLDLEVAQQILLDGVVHLLLTLELPHQSPLLAPLKCWHDTNRTLAQVPATDTTRHNEVNRRKQAELREIQRLVEQNADAQGHCLAAVQTKLRRFEYLPESIPFELFQNADDAAVELAVLLGADHAPNPASRRFVAAAAGTTLWFASWGRAINRHQFGGFDGSKRGFDQDLEKMLTLNRSDKGRDAATTGKFGLGFKSVLLAADRPRVVSDRLAFEVVGGLFPTRLPADRAQALRDRLLEYEAEGPAGTIIELPLLAGVAAEAVLGRFRDLAPLLPVFARQIRVCDVPQSDAQAVPLRWEPTQLAAGLEVGVMPGIGRLLVLRGATAALALLIKPEGIGKLPDRFPTVWVTAPTRHEAKLGLAINAPFILDVGRSQLALSSDENDAVADRAGVELGAALLALFHHADADWPAFRDALALGAGLTPVTFWESLWNLLARPLSTAADPLGTLLRRIFWGAPSHGMRRLITEAAALPNGLPGVDRGLVRLDQIRWATSGLLLQKATCEQAWSSPPFRGLYPPENLVSGEAFNTVHNLLKDQLHKVNLVRLEAVVRSASLADWHIEVDAAAWLGRLITPPLMNQWMSATQDAVVKERDALLIDLTKLQFRTGGGWRPAADLLMADAADDEGSQARFAPAEAVLHADYCETGVSFCRTCRGTARPTVAKLTRWAIGANDATRGAVLTYLDRGQMGHELAKELRGGNHWLARLDERTTQAYGLDSHQASVVLGRLKLPREQVAHRPAPSRPRGGKNDLERIYDWWSEHREAETKRHEQMWYPDGKFPLLEQSIGLKSSVEDRKGWMILLLLGALHTLGRSRAGAHRTFLTICRDRGWLDTFAGPTTDPASWMDVLIQYHGKNEVESRYLHWMGRFAGIFQLAHWLPTYVDALMRIEQESKPFELADFLDLRTSSRMSGTGLDAPPASRTLGIGACFVVRELCRTQNGYARHGSAHRHCYVPTARVRRLMTMLNCPGLQDGGSVAERVRCSGLIFDYVRQQLGEKATFGRSYDLPLIALTERGNAVKVLGSRFEGKFDHISDPHREAF